MSNAAFDIRTITLLAGISQGILAPRPCRAVTIFSTASGTAYVYSEQDVDLTALPIAAGWNEPIQLQSGGMFSTLQANFWLKCSLDATLYLLWT